MKNKSGSSFMLQHKSKNQKNKKIAQRSGTLFFRCMEANLVNLYKARKSFVDLLEKTNECSEVFYDFSSVVISSISVVFRLVSASSNCQASRFRGST